MNNSRLFRLSRIVIALTAASGMMVNTAYATDEAKAATQYTQQVNQNYAKSLPFSDRQDFDDAQRGFIAPLLDEGILRDANGKVYYRADDYKFDINAAAPETVNPSLWRQSQINGISGLTPACGVSRKSTVFLACSKSPIKCIRCAARISLTLRSLRARKALLLSTRW